MVFFNWRDLLSRNHKYELPLGFGPLPEVLEEAPTPIVGLWITGAEPVEVEARARENDLLVVTEDDRPAQIADMLEVKYIWISPGVIAKTIDAEIREKYAEN